MKTILQRQPLFEGRSFIVTPNAVNGANIFKPNVPATIISMTVQVTSDCVVQILEQNITPVTSAYILKANTIWSLPSRFIANNSSLFLSLTTGTANVEIVWAMGQQASLLLNHENRFYSPDQYPTLNDAPIGTENALIVRDIFRKKQRTETSTPLAGGATFTSQWYDTELDGTVFVTCEAFANVVSGSTNWVIQCTDDTTNANLFYTAGGWSGTLPLNTLGRISACIKSRYWRVSFVNGAGAQASFVLTSCSFNFIPSLAEIVTNVPSLGVITNVNPPFTAVTNADNSTTNQYYSSANVPVKVALAAYGGAFSSTTDAVRRGFSSVRMATVFRRAAVAAAGSTALWTPAAGNKFRLLAFKIQITGQATLAVAGTLTIALLDAAASINLEHTEFIPAAAANVFGGIDTGWIDLGGFGILSALANNVLNANLSVALVTGTANIIVAGTEE